MEELTSNGQRNARKGSMFFRKKLVQSLDANELAGEWDMEISYCREGNDQVSFASANMSFEGGRLRIAVEAEGSTSNTLMMHMQKSSDFSKIEIYYMFLVIPKLIGIEQRPPYYGSAILSFETFASTQLAGNYWTSQGTVGHYELKRFV